MCELMAMSFAEPIAADFSIREFAHRGEENADGWGLAWYPDRSLAIVKEPVRWGSSASGSVMIGSRWPGRRAPTGLRRCRRSCAR